jgi:hypothetical protein
MFGKMKLKTICNCLFILFIFILVATLRYCVYGVTYTVDSSTFIQNIDQIVGRFVYPIAIIVEMYLGIELLYHIATGQDRLD